MKNIFVNILIVVMSTVWADSISAQTLSQRTVSSGGNNIANAALSVSYTIGEMAVSTIQNANNSVTLGFQQPFMNGNPPPPGDTTTLRFEADKVSGLTGDTVNVPIRVFNFRDIIVFQKSIHVVDTTVGTIVGTAQYNLPNMSAATFFRLSAGTITSAWDNSSGAGSTLADSAIAYVVRVKLTGAAGTMSNVTLDSIPTPIVAGKKIGNNIVAVPVGTTSGMISVLSTVTLSGKIAREDNVPVALVKVNLTGFAAPTQTTAADGLYSVPSVQATASGSIVPSKRINPRNGVNVIDIALIRRHILNAELLNSPYKIIAADVNRDASVNGLDLVFIQQLILTQIDSFPNNSPSWRFVPKSFVFAQPTNPFPFPDTIAYTGGSGNAVNRDFVGVKLGDVNLDNQATNLLAAQEHNADDLELITDDLKAATANSIVTIPIKTSRSQELLGYQFTLHFDREALEFVGIENGDLAGMTAANFYSKKSAEGWLTTAWAHPTGKASTLEANTNVMKLTFKVKKSLADLNNLLRISSEQTVAENYNAASQTGSVLLIGKQNTVLNDRFEMSQNEPNPFFTQTIIRFNLPKSDDITLRIFDAQGRTLYNQKEFREKGANTFLFQRPQELAADGVYFYQITASDGAELTRKMNILR